MTDNNLEELIDDLRDLADEAGERADKRKQSVDMSEIEASHMALAADQGMEHAFQHFVRP